MKEWIKVILSLTVVFYVTLSAIMAGVGFRDSIVQSDNGLGERRVALLFPSYFVGKYLGERINPTPPNYRNILY